MEIPKIHEGEYRFCLIMWEHAPISAAQLAQQGEAIHAGKHGVQHQQVVDIAAGVVQAGDAVIAHDGADLQGGRAGV